MEFLKSVLYSDLYSLKSSNWFTLPCCFIDQTEVGLQRAHILIQCLRLHYDGLISVTNWKKKHLKMSTSPWTAKLTEFDILKKVLPVSIWEIDREWQNKWKKKKGREYKKGKFLRNYLEWKLYWRDSVAGKVRMAFHMPKTYTHTHEQQWLVFTQVIQILSKLHPIYQTRSFILLSPSPNFSVVSKVKWYPWINMV